MDDYKERWIAIQKEWEADYQDYLEWSESYEAPGDERATDFMIIMFWWVPVFPVFLFCDWMGWFN
jgi:hypothetical protein